MEHIEELKTKIRAYIARTPKMNKNRFAAAVKMSPAAINRLLNDKSKDVRGSSLNKIEQFLQEESKIPPNPDEVNAGNGSSLPKLKAIKFKWLSFFWSRFWQ